MPELLDDFGDPDRNARATTVSRLAHALPWGVALMAILAAGNVLNVLPEWIGWPILAAWALIYIASSLHRNFARICVRCMQDVPEDASRQAERKRWLLWIEHRPVRIALAWFALLGLSLAARKWGWAPIGEGSWIDAPPQIVFLVSVWATWIHHRLRPWCPFCRRWDDGQGPREASPTPDPSGVKTG